MLGVLELKLKKGVEAGLLAPEHGLVDLGDVLGLFVDEKGELALLLLCEPVNESVISLLLGQKLEPFLELVLIGVQPSMFEVGLVGLVAVVVGLVAVVVAYVVVVVFEVGYDEVGVCPDQVGLSFVQWVAAGVVQLQIGPEHTAQIHQVKLVRHSRQTPDPFPDLST